MKNLNLKGFPIDGVYVEIVVVENVRFILRTYYETSSVGIAARKQQVIVRPHRRVIIYVAIGSVGQPS